MSSNKKSGFDLSRFKKVSADAKHTTMLHPDGHTIKIAHAALSPKMRGELAAMEMSERPKKIGKNIGKKEDVQHLAQGGAVKYDMDGRPVPQEEKESKSLGERINYPGTQPSPKPVKMARGGGVGIEPESAKDDETISITLPSDKLPELPSELINPEAGADFASKAPQPVPMAASSPGELPYGVTPEAVVASEPQAPAAPSMASGPVGSASPSPMGLAAPAAPQASGLPAAPPKQEDGLDKAVNMQLAGINAEAKAVSEAAKAKQQALDQGAKEQQKNLDYLKGESEKVLRASNDAIQALKEHKIDPNRYFSSMGVGQRVSTGIGLILGGLAGAITHQENPALKMLNQEIDRDVEAQKMELGHKENLVGALTKQFGNVRDAADMARIIQKETTAMRLEQAAAKSGDAVAMARAQQASGILLREVEPQKEKIALRRTVEGLMQQARQDPGKVQQALEAMRQIDPERAKDLESRFIPGVGFALTNDDAKSLKEMKASTDVISSGVKRLIDIGKVSGKSFSPELRAEAESIATGLKGPMRTALGLGTLSEGDMRLLDGIIRNPTSIFSLDSSNKKALETLMKRTNENFTKSVESRGLHAPDPAAGLPPQQRAFVEWARKNPSNPKAKILLEKLGL